MRQNSRMRAAATLLALSYSSSLCAQIFCDASAAGPADLRFGGHSELTGDLLVNCTGQRSGAAVLGSVQILVSAPLGGRIFTVFNLATEALLLIDSPTPDTLLPQPVQQSAVPGANVIQGAQTAGDMMLSPTTITFSNVALIPPGVGAFQRTFRVTNIRVNTGGLPASALVNATIQINLMPGASVTNATQPIGLVGPPLSFAIRAPDDSVEQIKIIPGCPGNNLPVIATTPRDFNLRFSERSAADFRERNIAASPANPLATGDQNTIVGLGTFGTETGFFDSGFPTTSLMNRAGLATQGTRLAARISGIPPATQVWVTAQPVQQGTSATGITARLTLADVNGAGLFSVVNAFVGPYVRLAVINGTAFAVWEVFDANQSQIESLSFGVVLGIPATTTFSGVVTATGFHGPITTAANIGANPSNPVFSSTATVTATAAEVRACVLPLAIPTTACPLPPATAGVAAAVSLTAEGGLFPYTWSLASGQLPPGLTLAPAGLLTGTPTEAGVFSFTLRVLDSAGTSVSRDCSIQILPGIAITTACPLADVALGASVSLQLAATGGNPPFRWSLLRGSFPAGVTLSPAGILSGTTITPGTFTFTLQATDSRGVSGQKECSLRVVAPLRIGPTSIRLQGVSTGLPTRPHLLSITSETVAQNFAVTATTISGGNWLRVTPPSGRVPAAVEVFAEPSLLTPGSYAGRLTVNTVGGVPANIALDVTLEVASAVLAELAAEPEGVALSLPRGPFAAERHLMVANRGNGSIPFRATIEFLRGEGWLAAASSTGIAQAGVPARLRLRLSGATLDPGVYRARLRLESDNPPQTVLVPVALGVTNSADSIGVEPMALNFTAVSGVAPPPAQSFQVAATGAGGFNWQAAASTDPAFASWITVTPRIARANPDSPSTVEVRVNHASLPPGRYAGEIVIDAPGVDNAPRVVLVTLDVIEALTNPGPLVSPSGLVFTAAPGSPNPARQSVFIQNNSRATINFQAGLSGDTGIWSFTTADRVLGPAGAGRIDVSADLARVTTAATTAQLHIQISGDSMVRTVDLLLLLGSGSRQSAASAVPPGRMLDAVCLPGGLRLQPVNVPQGFLVPAGRNFPLDLLAYEASGAPLTTGLVTASLSGSTAPASLTHSGNGRWTGTVRVPAMDAGPVVLDLFAESPAQGANGCRQVTGSVQSSGLPAVSARGIVSAAGFSLFAPLAQGGMVALFGTRLSQGQASFESLPLPTELGATRVRIGNARVPLFYAGETQINGIVPYTLPPNALHQVRVSTPDGIAAGDVLVSEAQPAVFTLNQQGTGQAIIVHGITNQIAGPENPAGAGDVIVIYCEGLGTVNPAVATGGQSPATPLARAVRPVQVTIGGMPAEVQFAGLAPGFAGLYQVNAVVPAGLAPGDAAVVVTASGLASPAVTIAVK